MAVFRWNPIKNDWLVQARGMSFERIVAAIEAGQLLDILVHPNQERYPGQKLLVVKLHRYAWLVPMVESDDGFFLITAFPSRKATRKYLENDDER